MDPCRSRAARSASREEAPPIDPPVTRATPAGPTCHVMGIVNLTPDSFSDGGRLPDAGAAVEHALRLVEEGAAALDLGAESTRPGAVPVDAAEERRRLLPVLRALRPRTDALLSVDTRRSATARAALDHGADLVNDVSLLSDPELPRAVAAAGAGLVLVHSLEIPAERDPKPIPGVVAAVRAALSEAVDRALQAGCARGALVLDPGIGFSKDFEDNVALIRGLPELRTLGLPLLVGLSRKRLIGRILARTAGSPPPDARDAGSVGAALAARMLGADWLRVHDVRATVHALAVFEALLPEGGGPAGARRPACSTR